MQFPEAVNVYGEIGFRAALKEAADQDGLSSNAFVRELINKELQRRGIVAVATPASLPRAPGGRLRRTIADHRATPEQRQ